MLPTPLRLTRSSARKFYQNHQGYSVRDETFWRLMHKTRVQYVTELIWNLGYSNDTTVLDIGCGTSIIGEISQQLGVWGDITATDLNPRLLEKVKQRYPSINCCIDDAQEPEIEGKWDIVFAGEVLEHLHDPEMAIYQWGQRIKDGGYLIVTTPNRNHAIRTIEHISLKTPYEIRELFDKGNLELCGEFGIDFGFPIPIIGKYIKIPFVKLLALLAVFHPEAVHRFITSSREVPGLAYDVIYWGRKKPTQGRENHHPREGSESV